MATADDVSQPAAAGQDPQALLYAAQLAELTPAMRAGLQAAAVLHRFNQPLLAQVLDDHAAATALLTTLRSHGLVQPVAPGAAWFALPAGLRRYLRTELAVDAPRHRQAHARAAAYFHGQGNAMADTLQERNRLEYLYHLLLADETAAIPAFRHFIDQAEATFQWGVVERLMDYANEQAPHCSPTTQGWLQATTRRVQAEQALAERRWVQANAELQRALVTFQRLGFPYEAAQSQLQLGRLYVRLAEVTGGLREEQPAFPSPLVRLLYLVQHGPFLLYRRLARRYMIVPNLYFGTDYQNWTVIRFLYDALAAFAAAHALLAARTPALETRRQPLPGEQRAAEEHALLLRRLRIRQADLYYRIGRWHHAAQQFQQIVADPLVRMHPYLLAQAELGVGRTLLHRDPAVAAAPLQSSLQTFEQVGDMNLVGLAAALLATGAEERNKPAAARQQWEQAAVAYYRANNLLDGTAARHNMAAVTSGGPPGDAPLPVTAADQPVRAYIARFPALLHRLFQRVAIFVALPLTYLFARALAANLSEFTSRAEVLVQALAHYTEQAAVVVDVLVALPYLVATPLLLIWLYELIYLIVGFVLIRLLPLARLTAEQPSYLLTDATGCTLYDAQGEVQCTLKWAEVTFTASLNRTLWRLPLHLFSRFVVGNEQQAITVEGIVSHYSTLQRMIMHYVHDRPPPGAQGADPQAATSAQEAPPPRHTNLDYVLLARPWLLATVLVTTALTLIAFFNVLDPSATAWSYLHIQPPRGPVYILYLSSLLWWFLRWLAITGPLLALLHLWHNQRRITATLGKSVVPPYRWPVRLALLLCIGLLLIELTLLRL